MRPGVIGYGEVGQGIAEFFESPMIYDPPKGYSRLWPVDELHICFPYQPGFENTVLGLIYWTNAKLCVIHSTVPVGTTERLFNKYNFVVHSPVIGRHQTMYRDMSVFKKLIGADDDNAKKYAENHLKGAGFDTYTVNGSRKTELAKLLSTTYYGVCIEFHRYAKDLCDREWLDFNETVTMFNTFYNAGYREIGLRKFCRPILKPPDGKIGGHCVVPNAEMLRDQYGDHPFLGTICDGKEK